MYQVCIVGAGGMGLTHIRNIEGMPDARITDICDPAPATAALAGEVGAVWHESLERMLETTEAEIAVVCTPSFLHTGQVGSILRAGLHCICEKPLCLTAAGGRALIDLAKENGVQLYVAQVLRFWEEYTLLAQMIKEGAYGPLRDLWLGRLTEKPAWCAGGWMFEEEKSGLIPFDLHVHDIDLLVSLFGVPEGYTVQKGGGAAYPEYYRVCYSYPALTACVESAWYNAPVPFGQGFRAYFDRAVLQLDKGVLMLYPQGGEPVRIGGGQKGVETSINVTPTAAYRSEMEHFFRCAGENRPSDIVPHEQVLAVLEILEGIRDSK